MLAGLSLLLLLPFVVHLIAKRAHSRRTWALTGLSFGLIVSPASLGLYFLYVYPFYVTFMLGMLGLMSCFFHGAPGFEIITALGLRDAHTVVNTQQYVTIDVINGLFWGIVYGALGRFLDFVES
jgi:hypothetical protein